MILIRWHSVYSVGLFLLLAACDSRPRKPADWVFTNGTVYTVDDKKPWAQALAITDGRISYVGDNGSAQDFVGSLTKVIDLQKKLMLPGIHDAHVHPIGGAEESGFCQLSGLQHPREILEALREYDLLHPDYEVIRGRGWELTAFPDGNPNKLLLDSIFPNKPVVLTSWDGHNAWVNSKALQLADITAQTPNPTNGRIEKDPITGQPTGTLRETAMQLVYSILPETPKDAEIGYLRQALQTANAYGITSMIDASASEDYLKAYKTLDKEGTLTSRITACISLGTEKPKSVKELVRLRDTYNGTMVNTNSVKIFADGVPEAKTAALLEPYHTHDGKADLGILNYGAVELKAITDSLDHEGFQIHVHALGDKAVRLSLDALGDLDSLNRHQIAHLQIVHPDDIPRFGALGVIANFQPFWAKADPLNVQTIMPLVGEKRSRQMYPMGSVVKSGGRMVAGSDWPVSTFNPWHAIEVAVTRQLIGVEDTTWIPSEKVDLPTIIAAYTKNAAYVMHQDKKTGTLEVGKDG